MSTRRRAPWRRPAGGLPATVGAWLAFAEPLYARHGLALGQVAASAHDEALYLLLHTLGLPMESDARVLRRSVTPDEQARLESVFRRRVVERIPAAYLTGEAWLGPWSFHVDERVIIPRSYFLEIIPGQLRHWLPRHGAGVRRVADLCTGSGCLAVLLAKQFPAARVDATDLSPAALEVAAINVRRHRLGRRVHLFQGDLLGALPAGARYDVLLSNPPYEPSALVDGQAPEFAAEPRLAHDGGRDGLDLVRRLLHGARARLKPHGVLVLEVGGLRPAIDREFAALQPHWLPTADGTDCICLFAAATLDVA